jgi:hypothetical protein
MGDRLRGTLEGNAIAEQLFALVRKLGDQITVETVDLMVRRQNTYSRTGLTGLGILYDEHFDHVSTLRLTKHFLENKLPEVAYFCALREAYPKKRTYGFMSVVRCGTWLRFKSAGVPRCSSAEATRCSSIGIALCDRVRRVGAGRRAVAVQRYGAGTIDGRTTHGKVRGRGTKSHALHRSRERWPGAKPIMPFSVFIFRAFTRGGCELLRFRSL